MFPTNDYYYCEDFAASENKTLSGFEANVSRQHVRLLIPGQ